MLHATISIVSFRQKDLLERCLDAITRLALPNTWQVIVVDNNSGDGSARMVKRRYPFVKLLALKQNTGYAAGHNAAFARTTSPFFIVLNPDVIVLPGSLETLVRTLESFPNTAIAGPCLLNPDGSLQFSARRFYNWYTVLCRRLPVPGRKKVNDLHLMKDHTHDQILCVDWVLGAAMAVRTSAFDGNELFDTRYRLYFEDVDLCYFAQKRGWDVIYCPQSKMIHEHQRASATNPFCSAAIKHLVSWLKFYQKTKNYDSQTCTTATPNSTALFGKFRDQ